MPEQKVARNADPYLTHRFTVKIEGLAVAGFSEVSGLEAESDVETFRVGGVNNYQEQLAGASKFPARLVLKRGVSNSKDLWQWHKDVTEGQIVRRTVTIELLDSAGDPHKTPELGVRTWAFREAVPVKWVGPPFRASASEIGIETLELVHRGYAPPQR